MSKLRWGHLVAAPDPALVREFAYGRCWGCRPGRIQVLGRSGRGVLFRVPGSNVPDGAGREWQGTSVHWWDWSYEDRRSWSVWQSDRAQRLTCRVVSRLIKQFIGEQKVTR